MLIKQLSIFLENKSGRLTEVTKILGEAGINMSAFSMAENSDFGILRLIVSDPEKAQEVLKAKRFAVNLTDVLCISCPNEPGALCKILTILSDAKIAIEYMYAFTMENAAKVIIRTSVQADCVRVLTEHKIELLAASDLYKL